MRLVLVALLLTGCAIAKPLYEFRGEANTGVYWQGDRTVCVQSNEKIPCPLRWELLAWTRHYEALMNVGEGHAVVFGEHAKEDWCGWVDAVAVLTDEPPHGLSVQSPVIHYDLAKLNCASARGRAKHEVCHIRWQHHVLREMTYEEMEAEVDGCMEDYR